jgi:hypothetical protein
MSRFREIGAVRVWVRGDDEHYTMHPSQYQEIRAAWLRGDCFFEGQDLWGDTMIINLRNVVVISLATPDAIAEADDDRRDEELVSP